MRNRSGSSINKGVLIFAAMLVCGGLANAGSVTYSVTGGVASGSSTVNGIGSQTGYIQGFSTVDLPLFDPALGNLSGVDIQFSEVRTGSILHTNGNGTRDYLDTRLTFTGDTLNLAGIFSLTTDMQIRGLSSSLDACPSPGHCLSDPFNTSDTLTKGLQSSDSAFLAHWIGTGTNTATFALEVTYDFTVRPNLAAPLVFGGAATPTVELTYSYTPEPGSWILLGGALLCQRLLIRKRANR